MKFDENYWNNRYQNGNTGWDLQEVSPPIKSYIDQLKDKSLKILIPGGGYSFEAQYMWENGFSNVFVIDYSELALQDLSKRVPEFPQERLIQGDFFDLKDTFDLIIEQTFFCALDPTLRPNYVEHMYCLLNKGGKLMGLLFDFPLSKDGPPFGGSAPEYHELFSKKFNIQQLDRAYNSIKARSGKELFIKLEKSDFF